jgi:tetratricopeptide (TPR) repeat protein
MCLQRSRVVKEPSAGAAPFDAGIMSASVHSDRRPRRAYLPFPVLTRAESEAEGAAVLRELPSPVGVLLYGALRDVMLWLETPEEARAEAFSPGAGERRERAIQAVDLGEVELAAPLFTLARLADEPAAVEVPSVADACSRLAAWAAKENAPNTELAFAQAVALARPDDPPAALRTARLARDLAQFPRAETWFRYVIKLARVQKDRSTYVDAFLGLGIFYIRIGNMPAARVVFERALKGARRWRLRELEGAAHHELLDLYADTGELHAAYEHAKAALEAYGTAREPLVRLASDLARFWAHLGHHARAVSVLETLIVVEKLSDPLVHVLQVANLVRTAALAGYRDKYESARAGLMKLLPVVTMPVRLAACYVLAAQGDLAMHEWNRAEKAAREALSRAAAVGAEEVQELAAEVLTQVERRSVRPHRSAEVERPALARRVDGLDHQLTRILALDQVVSQA